MVREREEAFQSTDICPSTLAKFAITCMVGRGCDNFTILFPPTPRQTVEGGRKKEGEKNTKVLIIFEAEFYPINLSNFIPED